MSIQKKSFLLLLLTIPHTTQALWPFDTDTFQKGFLSTALIGTTSGLIYLWLTKKKVQQHLDAHKKRFRHHEFLRDRYEDALKTLADYQEYADIVSSNLSAEETAHKISELLVTQSAQHETLIPQLKKKCAPKKQELNQKQKEVERALLEWRESKKKALLTKQGPLITDTLSLALKTLDALINTIPYVESLQFMRTHSKSLAEEHALSSYLEDPVQLHTHLDTLIHSRVHFAERYPYRAYLQTLDRFYSSVDTLKTDLEGISPYPFQKNVIDYLLKTHTLLTVLKKHITSSKEFESECQHYDAEMLAVVRENDRQLRKRFAQVSDQHNTLKGNPEESYIV
jgi:hypothetical protein